jgi:bifunctional UDP-N-acetylglucosamine pyrophosphorylase / glucosamine-1-phosphate N-acetyltransferase
MDTQIPEKIQKLIQKGVQIPNPQSVHIDPEVNTDRISGDGVVIYPGCKIYGGSVMILQGAQLGYESPVTIENCQIGPQVELKGGYFNQSVFLKNVNIASGANVREGTIMEEESRAAHTVGLKQTILFPFVTLGSLINFCDCLMSGGTSNKDHSEVGSSYIHFNYTPNQDKATPSLIGDVPRGVMLNQRPIFLGGQGGLVGPCRLEFGTITAAGTICRKDQLQPGQLVFEGIGKSGNFPFTRGMYPGIKRIVANNIVYIANLMALRQWYHQVRSQFISNEFPELLFDALSEKLTMGIDERIGRLKALSQKMPDSLIAYQKFAKTNGSTLILQQKNELNEKWAELEEYFKSQTAVNVKENIKDSFLDKIQRSISTNGKDYISAIRNLREEDKVLGTQWLQGIVDHITAGVLNVIPAFKIQ